MLGGTVTLILQSSSATIGMAIVLAMAAILILCGSLAYFFYEFPLFFQLKTPWNIVVPMSGVAAAFFTFFIHTKFHDSMAILASLSGTLAIVGMFFGLRKKSLVHFIWTGSLCVLLVAINGYIYFSRNYIEALPLIQKITFAAALLWFFLLNAMFGLKQEIVPMKEVIRNVKNQSKK